MKKYLIDAQMLGTFRVTARNKQEALRALADATRTIEIEMEIGGLTRIEFIDLTLRDDNPEIVDSYGV